MGNAKKAKELVIRTEDAPGKLADVTGPIAQAGVNIVALCAYSMEGQAIFMLVTDDNDKVKGIAREQGWNIQECDVVVLGLKDDVGSIQAVANKLKEKAVNLHYCYASTCVDCDSDCACQVVLRGDDADAILEAV